MKSIVHLLATVLLLALGAGCSKTDGDRVTDVLNRCASISQRAAAYNGNPGAQANFVAAEQQRVDVSDCPADFRMAYQAHVLAWQQAAPYFANNNLGTTFIEGFASGLTNDPRFIGQANQQAAAAAEQINQTYFVLTQVAAKYGARIPRSVVGE